MKKILLPMVLILIAPATSLADDVFVKDKHGCQLMVTSDDETLAYDWKGKCKSGFVEGAGVLLSRTPDEPYQKETVTFHQGLREGHSVANSLDGRWILRSEAEYAHGKRNGKSVTYFKSGDIFERNYVDGVYTKRFILTRKNGERIEGEEISEGNITGKRLYANGDQYEGMMTLGTRNGAGKFTKKGELPQVGEFILDEFVDVNEEKVKDLMSAKFGLEFGMTKKQVEALTGAMKVSTISLFRNAFEVTHFPNEKINAPNMSLGKRSVYFNDEGKLWRVRVEVLLKENTYFGGGEIMQAYGTFQKWLSLKNDLTKSKQTYPHYQEDISSCSNATAWEKDDPESFSMAQQIAPAMAHAQRVVFDIGCGAIPYWSSSYLSKDGKEHYSINIRYGNLYATPLAYSAAVGNEGEMSKKMAKTAEQMQ